MTISTTILSAYDVCKKAGSAEFCREQAMTQAPKAIDLFLKSYETCLQVTSPENCRKMMAYDVPTPPLVPFIIGLGLGFLIRH